MKKLAFVIGTALLILSAGVAVAQNLRIGLQEDPDVLDPVRARTYVGRIVFTSLCDKLVDISPDLKIVPQLATSWSWSPDNKVLTMKLRTDALFHDDSKFNAAAAKANLERGMTLPESFRKGDLASIAKVDAPDPQTLVITLKQPDATLLSQFTDRAGMMISPKTFGGTNVAAVGNNPICSGPYEFVERVQNDRIVLKKFDKYYDAKDYAFQQITFVPIPDTTVRLSNLRAGNLDMLERLNPSDVATVKGDSSLTLATIAGLGFQEILYNQHNGKLAETNPFRDVRVRQAFSLAIDRDAINEVIGGGIFTPANQPFPPSSPYNSAKFPVPKRDIEKAKTLLKEAGMPVVKAELAFGNDTTASAVAQMIQAMVHDAGFELTLRPTEYAAMLSAMRGGNFQVGMRGWSGRPDPDGNIHVFMTCKGALNDGAYCNPQVDKLLNEARTIPDQDKRKALYDEAQTILHNDAAGSFLYFQPWPFALQKKVTGFVPYPDGMIRLKGVKFSQQ